MSLETVETERLSLRPGCRVLDLGCGEGRHAIATTLAAPDAHVVALDLTYPDLLAARRKAREFFRDNAGLDFVCASGLVLPFATDSFDVVICTEVLEHVIDYEAMLREIRRILKPSGQLAVSVPRFGPEWLCWRLSADYHRVKGGHVRIFRSARLERTVERLGLRCYARHWAHALHSPYWWLQCLIWSRREQHLLVRLYHRFLVWDLMHRPLLTRVLDEILNPFIGKSIVMYFERPEA